MKFFKDKYYGEVWSPEKPECKSFCVLEILNNEIYLHTNLISENSNYNIEIIYGVFNELGSLTFVNCIVHSIQTGIIEYKKYNPLYVFSSIYETINPVGLRLKKIEVDNDTISDLIRTLHIVNPLNNIVEIESIKTHEIVVNNNLVISIHKNYGISSSKLGINIFNKGIINFEFTKEKTVLESIEIYKKFQKFCIIYFSGIKRFNSFKSYSLNCNKSYNIIFDDILETKHHQGLFNEELLKDNYIFEKVIRNWYNNENISYCFDIIIENYLSKKVSNARRLTNSISSFEAFYKLFSKNKNKDLDKRIIEYENIFNRIDQNVDDIASYAKKIVRIRDYYVHGNRKQDVEHDDFDLLYFSLLLDFVVIRELSKELGYNDKYLEIIERKSFMFLEYQQPFNKNFKNNNIIE